MSDTSKASPDGGFMGYSTTTVMLVLILLVVVAMLGYRTYKARQSDDNANSSADIITDTGDHDDDKL
jgi:predicted negative regulator of RcsB-dependent stress response